MYSSRFIRLTLLCFVLFNTSPIVFKYHKHRKYLNLACYEPLAIHCMQSSDWGGRRSSTMSQSVVLQCKAHANSRGQQSERGELFSLLLLISLSSHKLWMGRGSVSISELQQIQIRSPALLGRAVFCGRAGWTEIQIFWQIKQLPYMYFICVLSGLLGVYC